MLYNPARRESSLDPALIWSALLLACIGLVMVYSASIAMAEAERFTGFRPSYFLVRHSIYLLVGLAFAAALFRVPLWLWQRASPWLFMLGTTFLVALLIPGVGREVNGARRWISLGFATFQPSELMKLFVVLYAADYTVRKAAFMDDVRKGFLPMFLRDDVHRGAAAAGAGFRRACRGDDDRHGGAVPRRIELATVRGAWRCCSRPRLRCSSCRRPIACNASWDSWTPGPTPWERVTSSRIRSSHSAAESSSAWDWARSVEKLFYLPEAHTDFLLAVIAEELGFAGVFVVIMLFLFLVHRAFAVGRRRRASSATTGALVAQGIGVWLGAQAFINMGVNMGLLPTKGLTLPLLSFGGTGIVVSCMALGILLRIDWENRYLMRGGSL